MTNETENREPDTTAIVDEAAVPDAALIAPADGPAGADDLSDDGGDDGIVDADDTPAPAALAGRPADAAQLQRIVEGALMAAGKPLTVSDLGDLFEADNRPPAEDIRAALAEIAGLCAGRGFELREVASGFRFQVVQEVAPWVGRLWEEKPQRYSRALLETLALIAYRQPITRGDIEDIRGVAVASNIVKTLLERDWVRVVGHKDVPGRPAMYATTRRFLDYFNLKNLDDLPPLAELRDLDSLNAELALEGADTVVEVGAAPGNVVAIGAHPVGAEDLSGEATPGDATPGEATPGEATPGEATPGDETSDEIAAGDGAGPVSAPTLASLAAGFSGRGAGDAETDAAPGADPAPESGRAGEFSSLVAALRARDQGEVAAGADSDGAAGNDTAHAEAESAATGPDHDLENDSENDA